ncbi:MAG: 30S ribosome-binding factor RbfA [Salibacteraceae bacterium]
MSESIRQQKFNRLVQRDLSEIFMQNGRSIYGNVMVSVTVVRISPDLGFAKIYLSVFPSEKAQEVLLAIKSKSSLIRGQLGKRMGKQARVVPELAFFVDDSLDYAENIDRLLQ